MYDLHAIRARLQDTASLLFAAERDMIRVFYKKLAALRDREDPLFSMWRRELAFIYGDTESLSAQSSKIRPQELQARYGLAPGEEPDLTRLLQSIQTFYSVLIKLIAFNMASGALAPRPVPAEDSVALEDILSGRAFRALGICNYCYEDWYVWLLKYGDKDTERQCLRLRSLLAEDDTIASVRGFLRVFRSDTLKAIYETVIPRQIRHALGEYYTPDWLAACTVSKVLRAGERRAADTRFIDPTCGAGTFLTQAISAIRADAPDGRIRPEQVAGFDINALAVLTAKANYLGAILDQLTPGTPVRIPIYHYDAINVPVREEDCLTVDTNCGLVCSIPLSLCQTLLGSGDAFSAEGFLALAERADGCGGLREQLAALDGVNARVIANILLNRTCGQRLPGLQGTAVASVFTAAVWIPVAAVWFLTHPPTAVALGLAAGCGVLSSVVPYVADMLALRRIPATVFGTFTSVNPVWAALAGWLFLSQSLDGIEGAGIALIAVSNVVISVRRR